MIVKLNELLQVMYDSVIVNSCCLLNLFPFIVWEK